MRGFSLCAIAALSLSAIALPGNYAKLPAIGETAPNFTATCSGGKQHDLTDFRGKFVVLEWFNDGCPFVVKHYGSGNMQALQKELTEQGVVWLTVASSAPGKQGHLTAQSANELKEKWAIKSSAILLDESGDIGRAYDAKTTPHMFVLNPDGEVIYMGAIDSDRSPNPESIKTARNHVREALKEAMAGKPVSVTSSQPYGCSVKF